MTESGDEGIVMTSISEDVDSEYMTDDDPTDRYDAARWLRKRVGVVAARDLPAEPSEEDFRLGLRSGMVLCNVLNKIKSGSVHKIVNAPSALFNTPDSTAQAAYAENVSNFLTAVEKLGLPTFDPFDLDPGGDFSCVVDSVLAMKAYSESGASDFTWTPRPSRNRKTLNRRNSEPAMNAFSRTHSVNIDSLLGSADQSGDEDDFEEESDSGPLYMIVSDLLEDRDEEDIPIIVENILNKVKEEFNSRLGITTEDVESPISNSEVTTYSTSYLAKLVTENIYANSTSKYFISNFKIHNLISKNILNNEKEETIQKSIEEERAAKEQERINREKEEKEKAKKKEEESIKKEKELLEQQEKARKEEEERVRREKELFEQQEKARREEEERVRKERELLEQQEKARREEEEHIKREKELLELQENAKKEEEERIQREKELLEQQEKERTRKEQEECIKKEKELLAQQEKARRQEERRIKKEKAALARKEKARKEAEELKRKKKQLLAEQRKAKKEEEARIKREKKELEKQERARRREEERIKRENQSLAQKEKAREEQEQVQREIELLALEEKAKEDEISAMEAAQINKEKEMEEEEEKARKEEEEQELLEIEREKERARKKEDYRRIMDEYNKLNVNSPKQHELVGQQDKELQELRNTISTAKSDVRSMQTNCQEEADNLVRILIEENAIIGLSGTHVHTLCQAAAGYKKVLEENRKLYNQVQDLKGSIRVYCRVRPFLPGQENQVTSVDYTDEETVAIIVPTKTGREGRKASMFNKVFGPSSTQEDVFSDTQPLIRSVLDGFNVCVFACGQTGAGKTYTLISNPAKKGINVPDAKLVPVSSADEVINLTSLCQKNRAVNDRSNRSHSFLTAHVFGKDLTSGTTTRGCMHLVDLAGNEKLDDSNDEATHVNKSLSALGDVMVALANKSSRVNYKTCKLTQLLQDALGAQAKILMFVHVHPHIDEALETLSTFKFVERFSTVEGGAGKTPEVRELKEQICLLKTALTKKEAGDPGWQEMLSSPRSGDKNGAFEEEKNTSSKQPAKSASTKKPAAAAGSAAKPGKQPATLDAKKKKVGK
ncbi:hypothetical protein L1987_85593 [Smallanthus sonchifolius]|uniref:Uncharacterized protein n=1 Tax=Smallanthus sonchifolius TaxID=185202 RepID=A0ACB8XXS8_9ASTR|nr:hypothetical protein L1987_85593 [Smallanthus sonchifolius]